MQPIDPYPRTSHVGPLALQEPPRALFNLAASPPEILSFGSLQLSSFFYTAKAILIFGLAAELLFFLCCLVEYTQPIKPPLQ